MNGCLMTSYLSKLSKSGIYNISSYNR